MKTPVSRFSPHLQSETPPIRNIATMSFRFFLLLLVLCGQRSGISAAPPMALSAADTALFEKKIRPVLVAHCYSCHSERAAENKKLRGGLETGNQLQNPARIQLF